MSVVRPCGVVKYQNEGRVVVVTGGARGIGLSVVQEFAESGATVISLDTQIPTETMEGVRAMHCDVTKTDSCLKAIENIKAEYSFIDVLVNNAAIQPVESYHPIHQLKDCIIEEMTSVNLLGYLRMARLVLPTMLEQESGVIVNLASGQAHRTARGVGVYGPIKSANVMQTRQWAVEYARHGVRVVSVSPGAIDTPMVRATLAEQGGEDALANRHPLGRIGLPREVAAAVLWLASEDAAFVTGTDLEVDGGLGAFGAFADPY